jgi:hypothetical protein
VLPVGKTLSLCAGNVGVQAKQYVLVLFMEEGMQTVKDYVLRLQEFTCWMALSLRKD